VVETATPNGVCGGRVAVGSRSIVPMTAFAAGSMTLTESENELAT
jgi:hypothetical protein